MDIRFRGQGAHKFNHDRDDTTTPLADKLRPKTAEQVVGQDHLGFSSDTPATTENIIFWGPPG